MAPTAATACKYFPKRIPIFALYPYLTMTTDSSYLQDSLFVTGHLPGQPQSLEQLPLVGKVNKVIETKTDSHCGNEKTEKGFKLSEAVFVQKKESEGVKNRNQGACPEGNGP